MRLDNDMGGASYMLLDVGYPNGNYKSYKKILLKK